MLLTRVASINLFSLNTFNDIISDRNIAEIDRKLFILMLNRRPTCNLTPPPVCFPFHISNLSPDYIGIICWILRVEIHLLFIEVIIFRLWSCLLLVVLIVKVAMVTDYWLVLWCCIVKEKNRFFLLYT